MDYVSSQLALIDEKLYDCYLSWSEHQANMRRLEVQIRDLNEQRNQVTPISRLNPDILRSIFRIHIFDMHEDRLRVFRLYEENWISFSQVCRKWRWVALDDACLWNLIHSEDSEQQISELLSRTKQGPLKLFFKNVYDEDEDERTEKPYIFETLVIDTEEMSRVLELSTPWFDSLLYCGPATALRSLCLAINVEDDEEFIVEASIERFSSKHRFFRSLHSTRQVSYGLSTPVSPI